MSEHAGEASRLLKALANEKRLMILCMLVEGEHNVGELNARLELSQSALSQHLAVLLKHGFVGLRKEGRHRYYRARPEAMGPLAAYLETMWSAKLDQLKTLAEEEERTHGRRHRNSPRDRG